jgi:hypothetical protein
MWTSNSKDTEEDTDSCLYPSDLELNPFAADGGSYQPAVDLRASAGVRFPEGALFVCADRAPLAPALREATRAMMQVAVKDASHGPCDYYYDAVRQLMLLLVDDAGRPAPEVVFSRETFETVFNLQWVPAPDAVVDDASL